MAVLLTAVMVVVIARFFEMLVPQAPAVVVTFIELSIPQAVLSVAAEFLELLNIADESERRRSVCGAGLLRFCEDMKARYSGFCFGLERRQGMVTGVVVPVDRDSCTSLCCRDAR